MAVFLPPPLFPLLRRSVVRALEPLRRAWAGLARALHDPWADGDGFVVGGDVAIVVGAGAFSGEGNPPASPPPVANGSSTWMSSTGSPEKRTLPLHTSSSSSPASSCSGEAAKPNFVRRRVRSTEFTWNR
eukprot:CAMPEP_0197486142 /NCGR_PEP_ID=MMETSP1311-20131121/1070_1 /TAXON_ID=464262 /ORGANISM="Genus nov. species nov., Strain RCC856" /LENGTH=129 /DNA_ID=CAMNT_0043029073 /DNA_START=178 /DNA_END=568 /DNA_ORIENTATION=+